MDIIEYRAFCLSLPGAEESTPFDETTLVMKVGGKMFSFADMENFFRFNVKCDPEQAIELRERYPEVEPGYHCNKKHWNTLRTDGNLSDEFLRNQILASYRLVVASLPKTTREQLEQP